MSYCGYKYFGSKEYVKNRDALILQVKLALTAAGVEVADYSNIIKAKTGEHEQQIRFDYLRGSECVRIIVDSYRVKRDTEFRSKADGTVSADKMAEIVSKVKANLAAKEQSDNAAAVAAIKKKETIDFLAANGMERHAFGNPDYSVSDSGSINVKFEFSFFATAEHREAFLEVYRQLQELKNSLVKS